MKYRIIAIACFLVTGMAAGQIRSGKVLYKVRPPLEFNDFMDTTISVIQNSPRLKAAFQRDYHKFKIGAPALRYALEFNQNEAIFTRRETMANDNGIDLKRIAGMAIGSGTYYSNLPKNITDRFVHDFGKDLIIRKERSILDWKIEKETRQIQGYKCIKAVAAISFSDNRFMKLTAWFAPGLPFQFGPVGFGGLPGLILGLDIDNTYLYADKIMLSKKDRAIKRPSKGKLISLEAYRAKKDAAYQETKRRYEASQR